MKGDIILTAALEFFKKLQNEMKTQETDYQAAPRFWTVGHYKWELARDGNGDRLSYYDSHSGGYGGVESFRKKFFEELDGMRKEGMSNEEILNEYGLDDESCALDDLENCRDDDYEFIEMYKEYINEDIEYFDERKVHVCNNDTFFLTKEECQRHIDANNYHYLEPHTYARTLFRCPTMEKLISMIEETDWDKYN